MTEQQPEPQKIRYRLTPPRRKKRDSRTRTRMAFRLESPDSFYRA